MTPIARSSPTQNTLPVPLASGQLEVPLAIRILVAPIEPAARWVWKVVELRAKEDGLSLALLFLSALGIFPLWISLALAVSGIVLISLSISNAQATSNRLEAANRELRVEKQALETQNHLLVNQKGELQIRYDDVAREKYDLTLERDRHTVERRELLGNAAQISRERDGLSEENRRLLQQREVDLQQNQQLIKEKTSVEAAKSALEEQHSKILAELGELQHKIGQVDDYRALHENIGQFQILYEQVVREGGEVSAPFKFAQDNLIPKYSAHRASLHKMLRSSINLLAPDDLNRIPLNGILRISEEEMSHIEMISKAMLLLRGLTMVPPKVSTQAGRT